MESGIPTERHETSTMAEKKKDSAPAAESPAQEKAGRRAPAGQKASTKTRRKAAQGETAQDAETTTVLPDASAASLLERATAHYPEWAKELARKYFTKTLTQFILYGNVRD